MSRIEIRCTLAKWHKGEHGDTGIPGRKSCGFVMGHREVEEEEPAGSPEEYRQREEDELREGAGREPAPDACPCHPGQTTVGPARPFPQPLASLPASADPGGRLVPAWDLATTAGHETAPRATILDIAAGETWALIADPNVERVIADVDDERVNLAGDRWTNKATTAEAWYRVRRAPVSPEPVASAVAGEPEPPSLTDLAAAVRRLREKLAVQHVSSPPHPFTALCSALPGARCPSCGATQAGSLRERVRAGRVGR